MKKEDLYKKGLELEYFTVSYNLMEALVSISFGSLANSIALIGFGLDSIIESLSGMVLIWRLRQYPNLTEEEEKRVERKAIKLIATTFLVLALYVLFQSIKKLLYQEIPNPSLPGIILATASTIIMPTLAYRKYQIGKQISSKALVADSKETLACFFLSLALLLGLGLNYLLGIWQADPIVGIFIVIFLFREGIENWKESKEDENNSSKA